jgi:hypothetical protein
MMIFGFQKMLSCALVMRSFVLVFISESDVSGGSDRSYALGGWGQLVLFDLTNCLTDWTYLGHWLYPHLAD